MSLALTDLRFAIQDQPRSVGVAPESARVLGIGDGTTTLFYLPLDRFRVYVPGSAALFVTPTGFTMTGIDPTTYTITPAGLVTFATAPVAGAAIAASFQVTAFADTDLANVLARNLAQFGQSTDSDANTLRGCQIEIISIILSNPEILTSLQEAEYKRDPTAVVNAYKSQLATLQQLIAAPPRPDASTPVLTAFGPRVSNYQPRR